MFEHLSPVEAAKRVPATNYDMYHQNGPAKQRDIAVGQIPNIGNLA
jgi:hypothetical protein